MHKTASLPVVVGLMVSLLGCGPDGPVTHDLSGEVTFDGAPVADGQIVFRAADGSEGSRAGKITDGRYACLCTEGQKQVEITATRQVTDPTPAASGEPAEHSESYIPAKYNTKTTLEANVTADGKKTFNFPLEP